MSVASLARRLALRGGGEAGRAGRSLWARGTWVRTPVWCSPSRFTIAGSSNVGNGALEYSVARCGSLFSSAAPAAKARATSANAARDDCTTVLAGLGQRAERSQSAVLRSAAVAMAATTGATIARLSSVGGGAVAHAEPAMDLSPKSASATASESSAHKLDIVLYQYEVCPYCNKVRAFLDFHKIPYRTVEVNPLSKAEIKFSDYKKVPVLLMDGEQFNDSAIIIRKLNGMLDGKSNYEMNEDEQKWFDWVDTRLIKILPPNIYRTARESFQTFDYLADVSNFNVFEREAARYFGAGVMYFVSKKLKKKYDIDDERAALYEAVNTFIGAVGSKQFLGGDEPNLADLSVFGVLRSIEKYDTFRDMMANSKVEPWYTRMKEVVAGSSRVAEAHPAWA
uniref:Prostaglandin E synthase 2 n=1 Tax=Erythrolobus australicus TaxID=1077150 RepID=A0A7S1TM94_9RHOD|mmetsp:Transcript_2058/g.5510  ORF Transcript_2058/g.5510 Transcript_2058/m.5510 type:complete len:395 (+) Transcript_2058:38-1222(+)